MMKHPETRTAICTKCGQEIVVHSMNWVRELSDEAYAEVIAQPVEHFDTCPPATTIVVYAQYTSPATVVAHVHTIAEAREMAKTSAVWIVEADLDREIAVGREETEPCEAGTVGCCINHNVDEGGCETW